METLRSSDKEAGASAIMTFLSKTKNGDYAPIEESSLKYARLTAQTISTQADEEPEYFYAIR